MRKRVYSVSWAVRKTDIHLSSQYFPALWKHRSVTVFTRSPGQPLSDYLTSVERITAAVQDMTSEQHAAPCGTPNAVECEAWEATTRDRASN